MRRQAGGAVAARLPRERKALRRNAVRAAHDAVEGCDGVAEHSAVMVTAVSKKPLRPT
jgi:hypothetical protein